jgi:hypothetical protein
VTLEIPRHKLLILSTAIPSAYSRPFEAIRSDARQSISLDAVPACEAREGAFDGKDGVLKQPHRSTSYVCMHMRDAYLGSCLGRAPSVEAMPKHTLGFELVDGVVFMKYHEGEV